MWAILFRCCSMSDIFATIEKCKTLVFGGSFQWVYPNYILNSIFPFKWCLLQLILLLGDFQHFWKGILLAHTFFWKCNLDSVLLRCFYVQNDDPCRRGLTCCCNHCGPTAISWYWLFKILYTETISNSFLHSHQN